ncbi:MAG: hypothetical protein IAG10_31825 [Planctomycetaceae bacterium]|nr:hypothetical protein [Planctomycetaceae bacterium]
MSRDPQKLMDRLSDWTARYVERQRRLSWLGCAGSAVAAFPIFFVTFWVIYAVLWVGFQGLLTTHTWRLLVSGFVVLLLIPAYVTANWSELRSLKFESSDRLLAARIIARASGMGGLAFLVGPQTAHAMVKVLSVTLLLGPGMVHLAIKLAGRASLLDKLDVTAISQALALLIEKEQRMSLDELAQQTHTTEDDLAMDLALVDGVVPLKSGELGYTLNDDLRQELLRHRPVVA